MQHVSLDQAKSQLETLVDAAVNGEEIFISRDDFALVQLVPQAKKTKQNGKPGSAKGLFTLSDDFDEPLEDFREYME